MTFSRRFPRVATLGVLAVAVVSVLALAAPVSTKQGINYHVSQHTIPFYVKALDFLHRHYAYQRLAGEISGGFHTDHDKVLAIYAWTRQNIRPVPSGWPVVDDHILNIIIRGYGLGDQMADVFTTLCAYAGLPAFWRGLRLVEEQTRWLIFSFVQVDGRWTMFDVGHNVIFTDQAGQWIDVQKVLENPACWEQVGGVLTPHEVPYSRYFDRLRPFRVPRVLRAHKQMPWPRLREEFRTALRSTALMRTGKAPQ